MNRAVLAQLRLRHHDTRKIEVCNIVNQRTRVNHGERQFVSADAFRNWNPCPFAQDEANDIDIPLVKPLAG